MKEDWQDWQAWWLVLAGSPGCKGDNGFSVVPMRDRGTSGKEGGQGRSASSKHAYPPPLNADELQLQRRRGTAPAPTTTAGG